MYYFKIILSVLAALFLALFGPGIWVMSRELNKSKTVGLGAVAGGLTESLFSPVFWIMLILFSVLFFAGSQIASKSLRAFLFWIPTVLTSTLGISFAALFIYAVTRSRHP